MSYIIIAITFAVAGGLLALGAIGGTLGAAVRAAGAAVLMSLSFLTAAMTSYVWPSGSQIVLLDRRLLGEPLDQGRLIAFRGEKGLQARHIAPGLHVEPFVRVLHSAQTVDYTVVPAGKYGMVYAKDGAPLSPGEVLAKAVPVAWFLDAEKFLREGGQRGRQVSVLEPGAYPINTHLFDVDVVDGPGPNGASVTLVPAGHVAVITSKVTAGRRPSFVKTAPGAPVDCSQTVAGTVGTLSYNLVPVGCRGVWAEALPAGAYFLNRDAYEVTPVDIRVDNNTMRGGYKRRWINLDLQSGGQVNAVTRIASSEEKTGDIGSAVTIKVEGWTVFLDVRVQTQVTAENAPKVVAAVGGVEAIKHRFIVPELRAELRLLPSVEIEVSNRLEYDRISSQIRALEAQIELLQSGTTPTGDGGSTLRASSGAEVTRLRNRITELQLNLPDGDGRTRRQVRVLDFQDHREALQRGVEAKLAAIGERFGVKIVGINFGHADIPAELLVARKREQLAVQFASTMVAERAAQLERVQAEAARATADQQAVLAVARRRAEESELSIARERNEGEAAKARLVQVAEGLKAQADVLGAENVVLLQVVRELTDKPEIIGNLRLPQIVVAGGGSGTGGLNLEGAAAVLSGVLRPQSGATAAVAGN
ncbi:MAG: hypothetical protein AAFO79_07880 [Pseudomonadota bacterium]